MIRTLVSILCLLCASPLLAEEKEGGIIGTGVIGQITGLENFEVSGMRFGFASDIELKGLSSLNDLRMGMTLALSTGRDGDSWQIKSLRHMPVLTGPITAAGEVMGVPVIGDLPSSGTVLIDGFWSKDGIVASRIVQVAQDSVEVTGVYDGAGLIGQVPVQGEGLAGFAKGTPLSVTGRFENGLVIVGSAMEGPFMDASPDLMLLEGYFQPMPANDVLSLQGVAIASAAGERDAGLDKLVRRCSLNGRTDFSRGDLTQGDADIVNSFCISASN
jgi:hypothetical protein